MTSEQFKSDTELIKVLKKKNKEIEELKKLKTISGNTIKEIIENNNKLWLKRFEWLINEYKDCIKRGMIEEFNIDKIKEAQNKEFA